jgi:hypothetical protein
MTEYDDRGLLRLVRVSIPPIMDAGPQRDLWPDVLNRVQERPRVSRVDLGLLGVMLACAPFFPRAILSLVYSI